MTGVCMCVCVYIDYIKYIYIIYSRYIFFIQYISDITMLRSSGKFDKNCRRFTRDTL